MKIVSKIFIAVFLVLCSFFLFKNNSRAFYDPTTVENNKFGIHIVNENDINDASSLVNSSGGDWGYVTFVVTEEERDKDRWQAVFNELRRKHLIPIVRIASSVDVDNWRKPRLEEINNWIAFLNSLNWVIENRYVVIANEPNHNKEWGGKSDPKEYAEYLYEFSSKLKQANNDFFVLPAGFDASAGNTRETIEESKFIREMIKTNPDVFKFIDGWTSHSYPNPAFSGSEKATGKGTITTYDWELNFLKSLKVEKDLPVFITETGWILSAKNNEETIGDKLTYAFSNVWLPDKRVVAVTPFILNYKEAPFKEFSWKRDDDGYYSFFNKVRSIAKTPGKPIQIFKGKIIGLFLSPVQWVKNDFKGVLLAENLGQSVWVESDIKVHDASLNLEIETKDIENTEPFKLRLISFNIKGVEKSGYLKIPLVLQHSEKNISDSYPVEIRFVDKPREVKKQSLFDTIKQFLRLN